MFILRVILCLVLVGIPFSTNAQDKEVVVILHGIAKTNSSMKPVEKALKAEGYETLSLTYPSTEKSLAEIADYLHDGPLNAAFWTQGRRVHFVTHSMGGLVVRTYLDRHKKRIAAGDLGRVVMLAPPNKGSEVSDLIHDLPPYDWFYGPAGQELTTEAQQKNAVKPYYDLGIIAGTKEWPYFVAAFVTPGKSDGRVTVENTKLDGMTDHVIVNGTHTFIMDKTDVHKHIISFLKNGKFSNEQ
ncbi:alpha/beta fold hydrolase [Alphaproteobacteria bacterium]|nr:alpha/beta fold hydrolase [Alphaproteobacteria bacterium]